MDVKTVNIVGYKHYLRSLHVMLKENIDYRFDSDKGLLFVSYGGKWTPIKLEGYQLLSIIAPGANGVTVKAHHKVTDRS